MVAWTEVYSVKVTKFDDQHKKLFRLIDDLHQEMKSGQAKAKLGGILSELVKYTKSHFAEEEQAMMAIGYPDFGSHRAEHQKFVQKMDDLSRDCKDGVAGISVELMEFLNKWLASHIMYTDRAYIPMMTANYRG